MEAKDTVIEGMKFLEIAHEGGLDAAAKAQAEITWGKAIKEAQRRLHSEEVREITEEALAEQRLVGRREVVDWIHTHDIDTEEIDGVEDAWDKQLKDWGINEIRG